MSRARQKAHQAVCLSNQKQISIAANTYTGDMNDYLPSLRKGTSASNVKSAWRSQLSEYIFNYYYSPNSTELTKGVFRCPTSVSTVKEVYNPLIRQAGGIGYNGYGLRQLYKSGLGGSTGPDNAAQITSVIEPGETFLTSDSTDDYAIVGDLLYIEIPSANKQYSGKRHNFGGVQSWVDGHGTYMKFTVMEAGKDGDRDYWLRRDKNKAWGSD